MIRFNFFSMLAIAGVFGSINSPALYPAQTLIDCNPSTLITRQEIDLLVEQMRQEWGIPGIAVAVIHKGEEICTAGYGVTKRGGNAPVNADTLFQINSLTKAFTALTVNMLVQDGQLQLDSPICSYLPNFQVNDPLTTQQISLRDLLSHQAGLPGHADQGRLWRNTNRSFEELIQRLPLTHLFHPLRSQFNYDNLGYTIAGEIVARISGCPWAEVCKQKILNPLRMNRTFLSYSAFLTDENSALPHTYLTPEPIVGYDWEKDQMLPASGIISCVRDMALWLHYCLADSSAFGEAQQPQIVIYPEHSWHATSLPLFPLTAHGQPTLAYGFGWSIYSLEDRTVYRHTGSSDGMQSVLAIVPEEKLGIVILSNQSSHPAIAALMNQLIDRALNRSETDWKNQAKTAFLETKEKEKEWKKGLEAIRNSEILPTLTLDAYPGTYTHLGYGDILIELNDGKLNIELLFSHEKGKLEHWEGDRFEIQEISSGSLEPWFCEFLVSEQKKVVGLQIPDLGFFAISESYNTSK